MKEIIDGSKIDNLGTERCVQLLFALTKRSKFLVGWFAGWLVYFDFISFSSNFWLLNSLPNGVASWCLKSELKLFHAWLKKIYGKNKEKGGWVGNMGWREERKGSTPQLLNLYCETYEICSIYIHKNKVQKR